MINSYTDKIYSKLLQFKLINNRKNLPIFLSINKKSQNLSCSVEYAFTLDSLTKFCEMKLMENIEPIIEKILKTNVFYFSLLFFITLYNK